MMRSILAFFFVGIVSTPCLGMTCLEKFLHNTQIVVGQGDEEGYNPVAMAAIGASFLTSSVLNATSDEWGMPTLVGASIGSGVGYLGGAPSIRQAAKQKTETFVLETVGTLFNAQFTRQLSTETQKSTPGFTWSANIEQASMGALAGMVVGKSARYSWKGFVFCLNKLMKWTKESYTGKTPPDSENPGTPAPSPSPTTPSSKS